MERCNLQPTPKALLLFTNESTKKIFPKAYAKARFNLRPDAKHEVELAFTHQGVEYWRFVNEVNIC